jgi:hypothetical protein
MKHTVNATFAASIARQSTLALAMGTLCLGSSVALAEMSNSLYGNFRFSFNQVDDADQDALSGDNNASRLGFKGEFKGDGLTAFYHLEAGADNDDDTTSNTAFTERFYYAGLRGGFGSLVVGRHSPAYKMAGLATDPFYDTSANGAAGQFAAAGATYGLSALTNGFANNAIAYTSPKLGDALTANAAIYVDDSKQDDEHSYGLGLAYGSGPITAGIQYFDGEANGWNDALKAYRLHGGYKAGALALGLSFENVEPDAAGAADVNYLYLSGVFSMSEQTRLAVSVGNVDEGANEGAGVNVGVFHDVFKNTTLYGLYSTVDRDDNVDADVFSVGMIYNFNVGF